VFNLALALPSKNIMRASVKTLAAIFCKAPGYYVGDIRFKLKWGAVIKALFHKE
jgi:hypothetical protein